MKGNYIHSDGAYEYHISPKGSRKKVSFLVVGRMGEMPDH